MNKKNKKLVLDKNTAKTLTTKTSVKTGTLQTEAYGRSSGGASVKNGSGVASSIATHTSEKIGFSG